MGHSPLSVLNYQTEITSYRHMRVGSADGYVRFYDPSQDLDDGEPIESYVYLPVLRLGDDLTEGILTELIMTLALRSGDIDYASYTDESAEEVAAADTAKASGTWTGEGRQRPLPHRVRGGAMTIKLSNGEDRAWAIERLQAVIRQAGRQRL